MDKYIFSTRIYIIYTLYWLASRQLAYAYSVMWYRHKKIAVCAITYILIIVRLYFIIIIYSILDFR